VKASAIRVNNLGKIEKSEIGGLDARFLGKFAGSRGGKRLSIFDPAAG
jgi:hypothetical protein